MRWTTRKLNFMLTFLQEFILTVLDKKGECSIPEIEKALTGFVDNVSYLTIYVSMQNFGDRYTSSRPREVVSKRGGRKGQLYTLNDEGRAALKATQETRARLIASLSPDRPRLSAKTITSQKANSQPR